MKSVIFSKQAVKALRRMPANTAKLIRAKIDLYASSSQSLDPNVTKLVGRDGLRLRVGDWRVLFDEDYAVVTVLKIGPRGNVYE